MMVKKINGTTNLGVLKHFLGEIYSIFLLSFFFFPSFLLQYVGGFFSLAELSIQPWKLLQDEEINSVI